MTGRVVVPVLVGLACARAPAPPVAQERLTAWLECVECDQGELDSVVVHGTALRDTLVAVLRDGPPRAREDALRRRLSASRAVLESDAVTRSPAPLMPDSATYTAAFLAALRDRYRQRAALALAVMGGHPGRAALEAAALDSLQYGAVTGVVIRRARDSARVRFP